MNHPRHCAADDVFAYIPCATEKLAQMQRNNAGSGGSRDSSVLRTGSELGTSRTVTSPLTESAMSAVGLVDAPDIRSEWGDEW